MTTSTDGGRPRTRSVDATWEGGYRCRVQAGRFEIRVDEPVSSGGSDTGPQPTEVFLASFASCFALAIAHVARKRDIHLEDLAVKATGTYDGPKFVNIRLDITSSHDRPELEKLVERAKGVCYVSNTLRVLDDTEVVITDAVTDDTDDAAPRQPPR
ncbi:MAG: OsmC family protein [Acidimicrobiales bacterium]